MAQKRKISRGHVSRIRSSLRTIRTTRGKPRAVRTVISASCSKHLLSWTRISSSREGNISKWKAAPLGIWTPVACAVDGPACSLRVQSCPWRRSIRISTQWETNPRLNLQLAPASGILWAQADITRNVKLGELGNLPVRDCSTVASPIPQYLPSTDGHGSWEFLPGLN